MTPEYLRIIERRYLESAGRGLALSPKDIEHIASWYRAGVPPDVAADAVADAYSRAGPRTRGLAYAAPVVERALRVWRESRVGGGTEPPRAGGSDALAALDRLVAQARVAAEAAPGGPLLTEVAASAHRALVDLRRRLADGAGFDVVDALEALADTLTEVGWPLISDAHPGEPPNSSGGARTADGDAALAVVRAQRWRQVRERAGLPALVLDLGGDEW